MCILVSIAPNSVPGEEEPGPEIFTYADWSVRCVRSSTSFPCDLVHKTIHARTNQQVLGISVAHLMSENTNIIRFVVPLGISLKEGVELHLDDLEVKDIRVRRCDTEGCYIEARLEDSAREKMTTGKEARVVVFDLEGQSIDLPFSLSGFGSGYQRLVTETRNRFRAE